MHPSTQHLHEQAVDRCNSLGLPAQSPCCFCGVSHKQPRRHLASCPAVYQASLANLHFLQLSDSEPAQACPNGGPCSSGSAGHCSSVGGRKRGCGDDGGSPAASPAAASGVPGGPVERQLEPGRERGDQVAEKGERRLWRQRRLVGSSKQHPKRKYSEKEDEQEKTSLDSATQALIGAMTRMGFVSKRSWPG